MSIRPVDMQVLIPKAADANNNNHTLNRPEAQQHQVAQQINKQVEHNSQSVIQTHKADKQEVNKDGRNKQDNPRRKRKSSDDKKDEEKVSGGSRLFDVKI